MDTSWVQVALKYSDGSWRLIGKLKEQSGRGIEMPPVTCPIVDLGELRGWAVLVIFHKFVSPEGVSDVSELVKQLVSAGAKVV